MPTGSSLPNQLRTDWPMAFQHMLAMPTRTSYTNAHVGSTSFLPLHNMKSGCRTHIDLLSPSLPADFFLHFPPVCLPTCLSVCASVYLSSYCLRGRAVGKILLCMTPQASSTTLVLALTGASQPQRPCLTRLHYLG